MDYSIRALDVSNARLVYSAVVQLLDELGEERADLGELDVEKITNDWTKNVSRVFVFAAFAQDQRMLGIVNVSEIFAIFANGSIGVINEMLVVPEARRSGIGRALLDRVKRLAMDKHWSRIDVTAPESDRWIRTRRFYEREGFTFAGPKLKFKL